MEGVQSLHGIEQGILAQNATDVTTGLARALKGDSEYAWFLQ